jgi:hypothetical protein
MSVQPKKKKIFGTEEVAQWRVSAQHMQGPGFNSPALLNLKKSGKEDKWHQGHFIHLIEKGQKKKRTKVKTLNYS